MLALPPSNTLAKKAPVLPLSQLDARSAPIKICARSSGPHKFQSTLPTDMASQSVTIFIVTIVVLCRQLLLQRSPSLNDQGRHVR